MPKGNRMVAALAAMGIALAGCSTGVAVGELGVTTGDDGSIVATATGGITGDCTSAVTLGRDQGVVVDGSGVTQGSIHVTIYGASALDGVMPAPSGDEDADGVPDVDAGKVIDALDETFGTVAWECTFSPLDSGSEPKSVLSLDEGTHYVRVTTDSAAGTVTVSPYDLTADEVALRNAQRAFDTAIGIVSDLGKKLNGDGDAPRATPVGDAGEADDDDIDEAAGAAADEADAQRIAGKAVSG